MASRIKKLLCSNPYNLKCSKEENILQWLSLIMAIVCIPIMIYFFENLLMIMATGVLAFFFISCYHSIHISILLKRIKELQEEAKQCQRS